MHVEREHGARAADLLRALDRLLHERTMTQMHAVKVSERDRTGFCNFYHRAIPLKLSKVFIDKQTQTALVELADLTEHEEASLMVTAARRSSSSAAWTR